MKSLIFYFNSSVWQQGWCSLYSNSLNGGWSSVRTPAAARLSIPVQTGPNTYPASCTMGTGSFPGIKWPGCGTDYPSPLLTSRLWMSRANFHSPAVPTWHLIGWILLLLLLHTLYFHDLIHTQLSPWLNFRYIECICK